MLELTTTSRLPFVFICLMGATLVTTALPKQIRSSDSWQDGWDVASPSAAVSDWKVSSPGLRDGRKTGLKLLSSERREASSVDPLWPVLWSAGSAMKRSVVADDAAFRERSKLLTSMERQKWLNSYMQKLLVVTSSG